MSLKDQNCQACHGNVPPLTAAQIDELAREVPDWHIDRDRGRLLRSIKTKSFIDSMRLANEITAVAEQQQHHPDLLVRWGELKIEVWTHAVNALTTADFILAAKIEDALSSLGSA